MKFLLSILFLGSLSQADIIKCNFTEPFINSEYSTTQSTLTYVDMNGTKSVARHVSFQIKDAGVFELTSKAGVVLQSLKLDRQGSDGMSDRLYPYSVSANRNGETQHGGCFSNHLK